MGGIKFISTYIFKERGVYGMDTYVQIVFMK
jgi:hypothetical protein